MPSGTGREQAAGYGLSERTRAIGEMFSSIAPRYDFLNRLLSFRRDCYWRREAVAETLPPTGGLHLDAATGTADVAIEILRTKGDKARVVGVDISVEMMRIALSKVRRSGQAGRAAFVKAPCESLPFRNGAFDSASIAFGIRNVADRAAGLSELCRVVRPGGRVVVLEFSQPRSSFFGAAYRFYFEKVLPRVAGLFSRRSAYSYLPDSVQSFPAPEEFAAMMQVAGCRQVRHRPLTYGIVTLYVGTR